MENQLCLVEGSYHGVYFAEKFVKNIVPSQIGCFYRLSIRLLLPSEDWGYIIR